MRAAPDVALDPAIVGDFRRPHHFGKTDAERRGEPIETGEADIRLASLDGHDHAPAHARELGEPLLAEAPGPAQPANVARDMSEDIGARRFLRRSLTVHYIAHNLGTMLPVSKRHRRIAFPLLLLFFAHSLLAETVSPTATPSSTLAPNLAAMVESYARENDFNGTILVQKGSERLYHAGFGLADRAFAVPADKKTRYKIASITKLFTSALILQLHQEKKIDLFSPIRTYLPDFPGEGGNKVTVHQLLNHTSGLDAQWDNVASYQEAFAKGIARFQLPATAKARMDLCCAGKLISPPGTKFNYNNADYFVLGAIIEKITGKSFEEALADRILKPAGLNDTGMMHWDAIVERLAPTYFFRDDTRTLVSDMPVYYENWYAAAGMYSSADDLLAFAEALYGGKLLKPETLDKLLKPGLDDYGYGLWSYTFKRHGQEFRVAKRPGSVMGANACLYRLIDRDATIVLLANTNKTDLDVFAQRIADVLVK